MIGIDRHTSRSSPQVVMDINVVGAFNMLKAVAKVRNKGAMA